MRNTYSIKKNSLHLLVSGCLKSTLLSDRYGFVLSAIVLFSRKVEHYERDTVNVKQRLESNDHRKCRKDMPEEDSKKDRTWTLTIKDSVIVK